LENETAFVGGIKLNPHSMVAPSHNGEGQNRDVYVELAGPSAADVHHNFVQRWNEASERLAEDGRWGTGSEGNLQFPSRVPTERGGAAIRRPTISRGRPAAQRTTKQDHQLEQTTERSRSRLTREPHVIDYIEPYTGSEESVNE
jgi:cardiolipin synthase